MNIQRGRPERGRPRPDHGHPRALDHPALLYADREELLEGLVPFVVEGLERDEFVFVAARADHLAPLRAAVGDRSAAAKWADTERWHPDPAGRLRAFHDLVTERLRAGVPAIRLVGEPVWPDHPPAFVREWQRYESVLNAVLAPFPVTLVCLYDASRLGPSVLESARRTHATLRRGVTDQPSDDFLPPEDLLPLWSPYPGPPPPRAERLAELGDPGAVRRFLSREAMAAGVPLERVMDLCIAANEILINAVAHGNGPAAMWVWDEDGYFVCQLDDRGPGIADPLAGYRPPLEATQSGRGLWLARQLVDLLQILPRSDGAAVRLHVRRGR